MFAGAPREHWDYTLIVVPSRLELSSGWAWLELPRREASLRKVIICARRELFTNTKTQAIVDSRGEANRRLLVMKNEGGIGRQKKGRLNSASFGSLIGT